MYFCWKQKNYVVTKQHIINSFKEKISWEFILTSRISTLCSGCYISIIKCLRHHLSGHWSRYTVGRYIERSLTYNPKGGPQRGRYGQVVALKRWSLRQVLLYNGNLYYCCVPAQIPYLEKFLFLRYGPQCSQQIRL